MPELSQHRALLAVNDETAASVLRGYFRSRGDFVDLSAGADVLATARECRPCLVILEIQNHDRRLEWLRRDLPEVPVVGVVPRLSTMPLEAAEDGLAAILTLPLTKSAVAACVARLLRTPSCGCRAGVHVADSSAASVFDLPSLFNSSPRMVEIRETIEKVANTSATVLIRGESGVGKEIAARMIFLLSGRSDKPFLKVNCAAIPHELLESELFGYEAGAFTGALRSKPGKFELANGGTIFLDEIAEMHPALQAKLLNVLQDGEFARLGAKRDTTVDVRVICATNRQLEARVESGLFREDLLYRINVVTVNIPPLRERRAEIPNLIRYFLDKYSALYQRSPERLKDEAMEAMIGYHWPGNIRELENFCKRYVIVGDATSMVRELQLRPGSADTRTELPAQNGQTAPVLSFPAVEPAEPSLLEIGRKAAWQAERTAIENMLTATRWNRREAARRLQISYKALLNKIKLIEHEGDLPIGKLNT